MQDSRRSFLRKAAGAAPIVYQLAKTGPRLKAAESPNDQIGLGYIGVGIRGTILLNSFKEIPGTRQIIAADAYDGHLDRFKELTTSDTPTTRDYEKVLNNKDVDAVVIATPDHWHLKMTTEALAAGKHVYIEKPMTWSIEEGPKIIRAEKKSGKVLQVGSGASSSMITAKAKELIKEGAIGKVNMIRMSNNRNSASGAWVYPIAPDASQKTIDWERFIGPSPKRDYDPAVFFRWRCWWEYSGGVATDLFVHLLTSLHEFMDVTAPKSVVSQGGLYKWKDGRTVPDVMNSIFEYEEGFVADMYVNLCSSYSPHRTVIQGTKGSLEMGGRNGLTLYPDPPDTEADPYATDSWPEAMQKQHFAATGYTPGQRTERSAEKTITVERGLSHTEYFIQSMREGKPSVQDASKGHYAAAAAHLANKAYRDGSARVSWDYRTNKVVNA
jgi:predicted dehydrogenase